MCTEVGGADERSGSDLFGLVVVERSLIWALSIGAFAFGTQTAETGVNFGGAIV